MLVIITIVIIIITIVISPLVIKVSKYRWGDVDRTLETQEG
jgi:membrane protein YdbS with pleckstrin-like domain